MELLDESPPSHGLTSPAFLRLTDDCLFHIISFVDSVELDTQTRLLRFLRRDSPHSADWLNPPATVRRRGGGGAPPASYGAEQAMGVSPTRSQLPVHETPITDLKNLALVHRRFLHPVRTRLLRRPALDAFHHNKALANCPCPGCTTPASSSITFTSHPATLGPLAKLVNALQVNESIGSYIRHLPKLGDLSSGLGTQVSPAILSRNILVLLKASPNLVTLDLPAVEMRHQDLVIDSVCQMRSLRSLHLGYGCGATKDGTALVHEGDLRRIAACCSEIEQLTIATPNFGCQATSGWVEPFAFKRLQELVLENASSITDKHLLALVAQSTRLRHLEVKRSAALACSPRNALTIAGLADVIERRGKTLQTLLVDISPINLPSDDSDSPGMIPPIQNALTFCTALTDLTLIGPSLVNETALPTLGCPSRPSLASASSFHIPPPSVPQGLAHLERLTLGLYPTSFDPLLAFLQSLPSNTRTTTSAYSQLTRVNLMRPPKNCTSSVGGSSDNVETLWEAVAAKPVQLRFSSSSWERDVTWARRASAIPPPQAINPLPGRVMGPRVRTHAQPRPPGGPGAPLPPAAVIIAAAATGVSLGTASAGPGPLANPPPAIPAPPPPSTPAAPLPLLTLAASTPATPPAPSSSRVLRSHQSDPSIPGPSSGNDVGE